jgi:hypothetical protein
MDQPPKKSDQNSMTRQLFVLHPKNFRALEIFPEEFSCARRFFEKPSKLFLQAQNFSGAVQKFLDTLESFGHPKNVSMKFSDWR